jgi:hypothetical protein
MTRSTSRLLRTGRRAAAASAVALVAFSVGIAVSPALGLTKPPVTFGRIPQRAITSAGIKWSAVPDYVAVLSHGRTVGYVAKSSLDGAVPLLGPRNGGSYTPASRQDPIVVNRALHVVGKIVPMVGFVAQGQPAPNPTVTPTTVYGNPTAVGGSGG